MAEKVLTVGELLDGHAALDIQCLDRIYLNTYVPTLHTSSQVVAFLSGHLGFPFASPALFNKIGQRFRKAVADYAKANSIPWIVFGKGDDKLAVMTERLRRRAATGCSGVAAIGVAQEFQRVWTASEGQTSTGTPRWSFFKADRRVPVTTSTCGTTTSVPGSSRSAPTSPTPARCGSTAMNGPSARPPRPAPGSPRCPTASPPATTRPPCRTSVTGSAPAPSACSSNVLHSGGR